ncbi:MAG: nitrile hydratase subunit beta, partial [Nitrospiraceae bacterium]
EGRVPAMMAALGVFDGFRLGIEAIPAADYLRMSYYERWLVTLNEQIIKYGVATRTEIERGRPDPGSVKATPALTPAEAREFLFRTSQSELEIEVAARFQVGERVRGRNIHPTTHTRMPRYTRGKTGIVERDRGVFALPDNEVYDLDPKPQHVYLVRFMARELWGEEASAHDSLYIDMWGDYLEPA